MTERTPLIPETESTTPTTRRPSGKTYCLTDRDVAIMESISTARFITAEALEWLHVTNWQQHWERHQAHGRGTYQLNSYLYKRLKYLLREGWIWRYRRAIQMHGSRFGHEPDVYILTEQGARMVAEVRNRVLDAIGWTRVRPRSYFTISHGVEIGVLYAALRATMERVDGIAMEAWAGDHITAKGYDRVLVRRRTKAGQPEHVKLPVQPDATFVWVHPGGRERIFVEVDRGTRALTTWIEKIQAYAAYMGSDELKARYQTDTFTVLTIAPHERQRQALMQATAGVLGKPHGRYLFALKESVHPTRIGPNWLKVGAVTPTSNLYKPVITSEPHPLLR